MFNSNRTFATYARRSLSCAIPLLAMLTHAATAKPVSRPRLRPVAYSTPGLPTHLHGVTTIPIYLSASPDSSGSTFTVTVEVESVPSGGGTVMVGCDSSGTLVPPGGTWPYALNFPAGSSTTGTFTLSAAQGSSSPAVVTVYTYPEDASDPADSSCWTQAVSVPVGTDSLAAKRQRQGLR
jgi:hypothetical protein